MECLTAIIIAAIGAGGESKGWGCSGVYPGDHMSTTTIIIIIVLILVFGGGGFYWRGRR
jgi:hypothetical protein